MVSAITIVFDFFMEDNLQRFIEAKPAEFRKIVAPFGRQDTFVLEGEQYKRPLNPALPDDL